MALRFLTLIALTGILAGKAGPAAPQPAAPPFPSPGAPDAAADDLYALDLKAYRNLLTREELAALEAVDPGPSLYVGAKTGPERNVSRLFASLPDEAHAQLRREGYLKWRVDRLPPQERRRLKEMVKQLESRGEGPFPLEGEDPASLAATGFVRVVIPGLEGAQYSWWITAPKARRPAWLTFVRAVGLLTQAYSLAHRERLAGMGERPETSPIAPEKWLKLKDTPPPEPEKPTLTDESDYWSAVKAYRGELHGGALEKLTLADPLVGRRLKTSDAGDRAANQFFARLTDKEHHALLTTGRLRWTTQELTKAQIKLLAPLVQGLNERARQGGEARDLFSLIPYGGTTVGFAVVPVPGVEKPAVSWWIRSRAAPNPAWVTLINGAAAGAPGYFRAHLEALGGDD